MTTERHSSSAAIAEGTLGAYLRGLAEDPSDPNRPVLVVQGGGLRGIYSLSALAVLEELGLRNAFSRVVGSSAGAINGAYFLAGQAQESISIYSEDLSNRDFVCPWRLWKIVDIDYMIEILKRKHQLDEREMLAAPATLYTVLTDAETAAPKVVSNRDRSLDVYEVFRATAALPGLYNKKIELGVDGRHYVDGGVAGLVPLAQAQAEDPLAEDSNSEDRRKPHKEALVLLTRGEGHRKTERNIVFRSVVSLLSHGQSKPVRKKICLADGIYNDMMDTLEAEHAEVPRHTWTLRPTDLERLVNRTTNDRDRLLDCAELARTDTLNLLAQEHRSSTVGG
ncbi:MAG TPA: patatin-like phospholipase family protein [Solirubrobacterales bacterium]